MTKKLDFYREEWKLFRKWYLRTFLLLSVLFIVLIIISMFYFRFHPEAAQKEIKAIGALFSKMSSYSHFRFLASILIRNLIVCFIILLMGLIPFILFPILPIIKNTYTLAALIHWAGCNYTLLTLTAGILPHGIIEFPVIIYTTCIGVHLSIRRTRNRNVMMAINLVQKESADALNFSRALKIYALIVVPLLVLAALIETFLTPVLFFATIKII